MIKRPLELFKTSPYREISIFTIPALVLVLVLAVDLTVTGSQQFSELAHAFLHGQLNFLSPIGGLGQDPVLYHGKIFWDEGPLPAVLLMPFVGVFSIFHLFFYQSYLECVLVFGVLYFIFRLARLLAYSTEDSAILTLGFMLGSVFIGVVVLSTSWYFAQVVTTFLLLWSIYEFYTRRRWWLIGIICALVLMTRVTAAPIIIFFALELWQTTAENSRRLKRFIKLCLPVVGAIGLLGLYNFLRFHNPFNGGFAYQLVAPGPAESRSLGIFSLVHIPANLYSAVLRAPIPVLRNNVSWTLKFPFVENNYLGMSIFITSPYLLYLFTQKWSAFGSRARNLIVAMLISALLVLSYYGIGQNQFGDRYTLDFLPELFLLFMIMYRKNHKHLSRGMKTLLLGSGLINFYLLLTFI